MSYQMKYEYNEELEKDVLHLPLFSIYTRNIFSDIINMKGVNEGGKNGMQINIKKIKAMVVSKKPNSLKINIAIDGQHMSNIIYVSSELNN